MEVQITSASHEIYVEHRGTGTNLGAIDRQMFGPTSLPIRIQTGNRGFLPEVRLIASRTAMSSPTIEVVSCR